MRQAEVLVVGATGQVGSQIVKTLAAAGRPVVAFVRRAGDVVHQAPEGVRYALGDLRDDASLDAAVAGVDAVVSTANAVAPRFPNDDVRWVNQQGAVALIAAAERAGVRRFVQASSPRHPLEERFAELAGRRAVEERLRSSPMSTVAIRNPAFADTWLVMAGAKQAMGDDPHATLRRPYPFTQRYLALIGDLIVKRRRLIAYGGADHGACFITTRDVAHAFSAAVDAPIDPIDGAHAIWEVGGPQWLSWREIAALFSDRLGGAPVRTVPYPAHLAALSRAAAKPFSATAASIFGLVQVVATHRAKWDSSALIERLGVPPQLTVAEYLDRHFHP